MENREYTFTEMMLDIGIYFLFVVTLCFLAVSIQPNPARADESTGPFTPMVQICTDGPNGTGCQRMQAAPVETLAECGERGKDFTARIKDGRAIPPEVKQDTRPTKYVWVHGCVSADGGIHAVTEEDASHGGAT